MANQDIQATVTSTILEHLKRGGLPPWKKRWVSDNNAGSPRNFVSQKSYTGCNPILLQIGAERLGFSSRWWGTFQQWKSAGGNVMRRREDVAEGKWGTRIVYVSPLKKKTKDHMGDETEDTFLLLKSYVVFNIDQVDGEHLNHLRVGTSPITDEQMDERFDRAQKVIDATGITICHGGNKAFYSIANDVVHLPFPHQFHSREAYFETAAHEMAHACEAPSRLNWDRANEGYERGELIAEISSSYFSAELGLRSSDYDLVDQSSYLEFWLSRLKNDPSLILKASAQASRVVDYIFSFSRVEEPEELLV